MQLTSRFRFAAHLLKEERQMARAARKMPKPVPWAWARPRLMPLLAGPRLDEPGEEVVRSTAGPGCAIEFGIDLGGVFPIVDAIVAERWECSAEQLRETALANLARRVGGLTPAVLSSGTLSGRIVRLLRVPKGCAASIVLLANDLTRLFGTGDQILTAPARSMMVSWPIDTPTRVVADAVVDWEMHETWPLMYDPFVLIDGELIWQSSDQEDDWALEAAG